MSAPRLRVGGQVTVRLPGRKTNTRCRVCRIDDTTITVVDPKNGNLRTVSRDAVRRIHRSRSIT